MWLATDRVRPPAPPTTTRSPIWAAAEEPIGSGSRSMRPSACTRPKPVSESKPSAWPSHHAAVAEMQPDRFGLGDQIADGQHQSVVDHHAIAGALGAEGVRAEGVGGDDRMQPDHRSKHAIEIETVVARRGAGSPAVLSIQSKRTWRSSDSIKCHDLSDWITTRGSATYRNHLGCGAAGFQPRNRG